MRDIFPLSFLNNFTQIYKTIKYLGDKPDSLLFRYLHCPGHLEVIRHPFALWQTIDYIPYEPLSYRLKWAFPPTVLSIEISALMGGRNIIMLPPSNAMLFQITDGLDG
ncbi:MAG: hypothetical protein D4R67_08430 [Bacteroidetes bacterium]|nr:MAG: hypothetical protein D4R67_08430 [Bacteroidota bacterium]